MNRGGRFLAKLVLKKWETYNCLQTNSERGRGGGGGVVTLIVGQGEGKRGLIYQEEVQNFGGR